MNKQLTKEETSDFLSVKDVPDQYKLDKERSIFACQIRKKWLITSRIKDLLIHKMQ